MELTEAYRQIAERLDRIDFRALFRGFHRFPFALYDENRACVDGRLIDKPADFLGNTSVLYEGRHTAIWQLTGETRDFDTLTSKIVHEMLHAFQNASGESRWADERAAMVRYRYDADHIAARLAEAALLRKCLAGDDPEAFGELLRLRRARMERFPYEYDYEARIEQIEGTANHVELAALAQLNPAAANERMERLPDALADPARYFPVRAVTYLSGAAFLACLHRYTDLDTDAFTDTPFAVRALEGVRPCALPKDDGRAAACLEAWLGRLRETANRAVEKGDAALSGDFRLVAWNVYDGAWDGRYAVLSHFAGYVEGRELPSTDEELFAQMRFLYGDFVADLDEDLHFTRLWRQ